MNPIDSMTAHVLHLYSMEPGDSSARAERDRTIAILNTMIVRWKRDAANELRRVIHQTGIAERTQ